MTEIIITSSILILALILLRKLCWGKVSRRLQYGLWLLVVIRLLIPAQFFTSSFSIMQVIDYAGEVVYKQWELIHSVQQESVGADEQLTDIQVHKMFQDQIITDSEERSQLGREDSQTLVGIQNNTGKPEVLEGFDAGGNSGIGVFGSILLGIYIVGVLTIAGCLILCNLRFRKSLVAGRSLIGQEGRLKVYLADQLKSPCLCGVFAPAIYMTEAGLATQERKNHILLHEMTHYKHGDHIWTLVRSLCLVLYWFHPLVWVAAVLSTQDSELACDEGTLIKLGEENRQVYGRTLIEMTTGKTKNGQLLYCATGMINGKKEIKKRITAIAAYKKQMIRTAVLVVVFALLLSACTAGNALEEKDTSENSVSREDSEELKGEREVLISEGTSEQGENSSKDAEGKSETGVIQNDDGSFRLSEYEVDLTNDKVKERIVFDVFYWGDIVPKSGVVTEELLWDNLWKDCEVVVKVLEGSETKQQETILQEYSFSDAHAGNGNLAIVRYEGQMCLLRYSNAMYQGTGQLEYKVWQVMPSGSEPVLRAENRAPYESPYSGNNDGDVIAKVLEVADELDDFLSGYDTEILLNATVNGQDNCYLYGSEKGLLNGVRRQNAFDVFMAEFGGTGFELKLQDYFYPDGMESLTQLPENAEERILAGEIICMEVSQENNTAGRLDLDGDGEKEVLYLEAISSSLTGDGYDQYGDRQVIDDRYRVRVDRVYYEDYCSSVDPVLMAYSPDGKTILLAIFDHGPSADPLTTFFRYDGETLVPAGEIDNDIRSMELVGQGVIKGNSRAWIIQTDSIVAHWIWNGSEMVMREEEEYEFNGYKWKDSSYPTKLRKELVVYEDRSESSGAVTMKPQEVNILQTDMKEWIYMEAEDGTKGWFRIVNYKIPSLNNAGADDVFEGLIHAG